MARSKKSSPTRAPTRKRVTEPPPEISAPAEELLPGEAEAIAEGAGLEVPIRVPRYPIPILLQASALYEWSSGIVLQPQYPLPQPRPLPIQPVPARSQEAEDLEEMVDVAELGEADMAGVVPFWFQREELRLDVDGMYPQMVVSGTIYSGVTMRVHWIANLRRTGTNVYAGPIWYKDGNTSWLPYTAVTVTAVRSWYANQRRVTVQFTGGGSPTRTRTYAWKSWTYRNVEFEYDCVVGTSAVTQINLGAHPNRPASLPAGPLSLETVYRRAGFQVSVNPAGSVPLSGAGANARWSDAEMHDAMQIYWSRFANKPQWSLWVLFASLHEQGTSLGGIMFDDIGPQHRQGTAIFNDAFISVPPSGDPAPAAWVQRMRFWTAAHEMGHAFNLAHSWQKALVYQGKGPWIPLANEPEARSFMNYPYNVSGGQAAFFANFEFRFTNSELLFMRHAPERFVEMGNAEWFDHHGFEQADAAGASPYRLELRFHREEQPYFDFLEPVVLELKLGNASADPVVVNGNVLESSGLTVITKKRGEPARAWHPFAEYCQNGERTVLMPASEPGTMGEALYGPLRLTGGVGGWPISEPGHYTVQVALRIRDQDVVSNPLDVRIAPPRSYDEELLAQDYFSEDVGRVLTFSGSRHLSRANDTLEEVVDRLGDRKVARHALVALATPRITEYKLLEISEAEAGEAEAGRPEISFTASKVKPELAEAQLKEALLADASEAAETFGHIAYGRYVQKFSDFLAEHVEPSQAAVALEAAEKTLAKRGVIKSVLQRMTERAKEYGGE